LTLGFDTPIEKNQETKGIYTSISTKLNYGFAEDRLRVMGTIIHRFNNQNYATYLLLEVVPYNSLTQVNPLVKLSTP
jgi:hypothetical protein